MLAEYLLRSSYILLLDIVVSGELMGQESSRLSRKAAWIVLKFALLSIVKQSRDFYNSKVVSGGWAPHQITALPQTFMLGVSFYNQTVSELSR